MPQGIPVIPRSVVEILPDWLEMASFTVKLDTITSTFSTGEYVLENLPEGGIYLQEIGYRLITPFETASDDLFPEIWFGDTAEHKRFGALTAQHLTDTEFYGSGVIPLNFEDTSTGGVGTLTAYINWGFGARVAADDSTAALVTAGEVELWLTYRANSERVQKRGKRAK